jgi:hypothetical protein
LKALEDGVARGTNHVIRRLELSSSPLNLWRGERIER